MAIEDRNGMRKALATAIQHGRNTRERSVERLSNERDRVDKTHRDHGTLRFTDEYSRLDAKVSRYSTNQGFSFFIDATGQINAILRRTDGVIGRWIKVK